MKRVIFLSLVLLIVCGTAMANVPDTTTTTAAIAIDEILVSVPQVEVVVDTRSCTNTDSSDIQSLWTQVVPETITVPAVSDAEVCISSDVVEDLSLMACFCRAECRRDRDCERRHGEGSVCVIDTHCGCNVCAVAY